MKFTFCPACGERLGEREIGDEGAVPFCGSCTRPWFSVSYPCVICLVTDGEGKVALIKQSYVSDKYVCVAGYIKEHETAEECAVREVAEETGLSVRSACYAGSYYYEKRDNLMLAFICTAEHGAFSLSGEVERAAWFTPGEASGRMREGSIAWQLLQKYISESGRAAAADKHGLRF